jgi:hypothetical protein
MTTHQRSTECVLFSIFFPMRDILSRGAVTLLDPPSGRIFQLIDNQPTKSEGRHDCGISPMMIQSSMGICKHGTGYSAELCEGYNVIHRIAHSTKTRETVFHRDDVTPRPYWPNTDPEILVFVDGSS